VSGLGDSPKEKSPHRCGLCGLPAAISAAAKAEGDARPAAVVAVRAIIAVSVVRAVIAVPVVRAIITVPVVRTIITVPVMMPVTIPVVMPMLRTDVSRLTHTFICSRLRVIACGIRGRTTDQRRSADSQCDNQSLHS
jgi:hypothetical protein